MRPSRRPGAPPGLQLHLAGQVATLIDNQASSNKAGNKVQLFSFLFIIVLLLVVFRSLAGRDRHAAPERAGAR